METSSVAAGGTPQHRFGVLISAAEAMLSVEGTSLVGAREAAVPWPHSTQPGEACSAISLPYRKEIPNLRGRQ